MPSGQPPPPPKLLDQVAAKMRLGHYSKRTERAYVDWIKRFILFHNKRHPREMGAAEIEAFLTHLVVEDKVAASTQNQAFSALLFLYQKILAIDLGVLTAVMEQGVAGMRSPLDCLGEPREYEPRPLGSAKTAP